MIEILGAIFIIALGCLGHFIYDWTKHDPVSAEFFAVNESTWEHIKLTIYPALLWFPVEIIAHPESGNLLYAQCAAMLTMIVLIPVLFYSYTLFTHKSFLIVDILCFCFCVCVGMWVFNKIAMLPETLFGASAWMQLLPLCIILAITAAYLTLTYHPRRNFLFRDPITQKFGIAGHPCVHEHKHSEAGHRHLFAHDGGAHSDCISTNPNIEFLRNSQKVFFVAMKQELDASATDSPVVYTGVGKDRAGIGLIHYIRENQALFASSQAPVIVSIGTAGSAKYHKGDIVLVDNFYNNGDSFIQNTISFDTFPEPTGHLCGSSDFFVGPENFDENKINSMHEKFDCMDMESYALASICKEFGLKFCAVKCISDGADNTVSNFDEELPIFRAKLNEFVGKL